MMVRRTSCASSSNSGTVQSRKSRGSRTWFRRRLNILPPLAPGSLAISLHHVPGQSPERLAPRAVHLPFGLRQLGSRHGSRAVDTVESGVGGLAEGGIAARALARDRPLPHHV